jgi:hypothetical protein
LLLRVGSSDVGSYLADRQIVFSCMTNFTCHPEPGEGSNAASGRSTWYHTFKKGNKAYLLYPFNSMDEQRKPLVTYQLITIVAAAKILALPQHSILAALDPSTGSG